MKLRFLALTFLCAGSLLAQDNKVPADGLSPHYEAVAKHLELGGVFYAYADVDTDIKDLTTTIDGLLGTLRESGELPIPPKLTAAGIVNELGLDTIKALGASSRKKGALFHNRAFLATGNGRTGLLKLFGGKAAPLLTTTLAPAGADLVVEEDVNFSVLLDITTNIIKQIGDEDMLDKMKEALEQPMHPMPFSVGEFLKKLDTKFTLILKLDAQKKMNLKDAPVEIPLMNLLISIDNMGWLFPELVKMAKDSDEFEFQSGEGFEVLRPAKPLPPEMEGYNPLLYHDTKSHRLYLASTREFLTACLEGKAPLGGDEKFKTAITGLPTEGNGLEYLSANGVKELWNVLRGVAKSLPNNGKVEAGMIEKVWELYLPKEGAGMASVRANLPDGMLFASNSSESHKSTLMVAAVYPLAIVGVAGTTFNQRRLMKMAERNGEMEQEAAPEAEDDSPRGKGHPKKQEKEDPSEKIESNLQQIAFAGEAYFLDHPKEKEVGYATLIKGGFLFEVVPVNGEEYKALKLKRGGGKLSVSPKEGAAITHEYPAVTD